jgi:predicted oxidoreductase
MQMAISAYKKGQFKSKAAAAEVFRVSRETLCDQLRGIKPHAETHANSHKLIALKEEVLTKHLLDANRYRFSI